MKWEDDVGVNYYIKLFEPLSRVYILLHCSLEQAYKLSSVWMVLNLNRNVDKVCDTDVL